MKKIHIKRKTLKNILFFVVVGAILFGVVFVGLAAKNSLTPEQTELSNLNDINSALEDKIAEKKDDFENGSTENTLMRRSYEAGYIPPDARIYKDSSPGK